MHQSLHPVHSANISLLEENRVLAKRNDDLVSEQRSAARAEQRSKSTASQVGQSR
jgi:hypothetical protein